MGQSTVRRGKKVQSTKVHIVATVRDALLSKTGPHLQPYLATMSSLFNMAWLSPFSNTAPIVSLEKRIRHLWLAD